MVHAEMDLEITHLEPASAANRERMRFADFRDVENIPIETARLLFAARRRLRKVETLADGWRICCSIMGSRLRQRGALESWLTLPLEALLCPVVRLARRRLKDKARGWTFRKTL